MANESLVTDHFEVLVVDDEPAARELVCSIMEVGGWPPPKVAVDGLDGLNVLENNEVDILVTDLDMPKMAGDVLIRHALDRQPDLTVLVMTGFGTIDRAVDLMKAGVFDFLCKPFEVDRLLFSLDKARERVVNLSEVRGIREVVEALMVALESKDQYLNGHSSRVSRYARETAKLLGLGRREIKVVEYSGLLHDVGKIGVHEDILNKPGKLTDEEFEVIKKHPVYSRDILAPVSFLKPCLADVLHHHERIDGTGYPEGIGSDEIPLGARIVSVVDCFDAMTSQRSYRDAMPYEKALSIIRSVSGTQLDSEISRIFLDNVEFITGIDVAVQT